MSGRSGLPGELPVHARACSRSSSGQRVDHRKLRKAGEIPVGGPENTHTVKKTKGGNPGIVHERTLQERWSGDSLRRSEVAFTFGEKSARETRLESF